MRGEPTRQASQPANHSKHFTLLEGETLEAWNSERRYRWDFSIDTHSRLAGFPHSSTRTTSWRPTTNFVLSTRWQYTTRASDLTPTSGAVTSTCFPGAQVNSVTTRAPRGLTFSVTVLSLNRDSSRRKSPTVTARSALFISASGYLHLALAPYRCPNRMPAELGPKIRIEGVWSLIPVSVGKSTTPLSNLLWLPPFGNIENLVRRSDGPRQTRQGTAECWALARQRVRRARKERSTFVPEK
jgi:hypothetical protein